MSQVSPLQIVNPVPPEELAGWLRAFATTFLYDPGSESYGRYLEVLGRLWDPFRAWGARDDGAWVGTLRTEARSLTVPGLHDQTRELAVDAVTQVAVAASHTRRGAMSSMVEDSLRAARERGDAASVLISAQWPIYVRFGFAPATLTAGYTLRRSRGVAIDGDPSRVRQVDLQEFGDYAPGVFAAARAQRPGQMNRNSDWWNLTFGRDGYPSPDSLPAVWLLHAGSDGPDGLLAWRAEYQASRTQQTVNVWELAAATDTAYRNLWAYLSGVDLAGEIDLSLRAVDEPVRWLLNDGRALVMTHQADFLWLRLLDLPAALTARRYAAPGEVVLEVVDDQAGGYAAGRYRLTADGDRVSCEPTSADADLELTQRALASIYLGGFGLEPHRLAGAVVELKPGALARVDLMFSTPVAPWNATSF